MQLRRIEGEGIMKKRMIALTGGILLGLFLLGGNLFGNGKGIGASYDGFEEVKAASAGAITESLEKDLTAHFQKKVIYLYPGKSSYNKLVINGAYDSIKWTVGNRKYASVTQEGRVSLKTAGAGKKVMVSAKISYHRNGKKQSKTVTYLLKGSVPVKKIKITASKNYVFVGKKIKLKVMNKPAKATSHKVVWKSSNIKYATVSKNGVVTPKSAGAGKTVIITAKATDGFGAKAMYKLRIIDLKKPIIALTFDDGPSVLYTKRVYQQLKKYDARATFFVLGCNLEKSQDVQKIVKASAKYGNEIASHTYNHKNLATLSVNEIQTEVSRTEQLIKKVTGVVPTLTRPPYGSMNDTVKSAIHTPLILWSIDTRDWQTRNADKTVDSVLGHVKDGDIVLMHDVYDQTASAAERIIPALVKEGYQLVTVSELATYKKAKLKNGTSYCTIR